jgi:hypothetical protein
MLCTGSHRKDVPPRRCYASDYFLRECGLLHNCFAASRPYTIDTLLKATQHRIHCLFSALALAGGDDGNGQNIRGLALADDFDKMAAVVDWLDACRSRNVDALLVFYADDASLDCACDGASLSGRSALAAYWRPKLSGATREAFNLEEITPHGEGVALDYVNFEGISVRIVFGFDTRGRISHMRCAPVRRMTGSNH